MNARRIGWLLTFALLAACGSDDTENNETPECPIGTAYNPILGDCVRTGGGGTDTGSDTPDMGNDEPDLAIEDVGMPDMPDEPDLSCQTDADGDGAIAMECGGDDCDDNDGRRAPGFPEICDEVDNNCDDALNEELACSVLAHSNTRLYRVDFFAGTYEDLGETVENLYDIDTHPDGTLYGIAGTKLYRYDENAGTWNAAPGELSLDIVPNGFCIDNDGNAFLTGSDSLRSVDLVAGTSTTIGSMRPLISSGDCVVNKGNLLFVTSSHTTPDTFSRVNGDTGQAMIVGQTGNDSIWALTAAYNRVFGMTVDGDVIEIDVATGATTLVTSYPELSFYGAASTPSR